MSPAVNLVIISQKEYYSNVAINLIWNMLFLSANMTKRMMASERIYDKENGAGGYQNSSEMGQ